MNTRGWKDHKVKIRIAYIGLVIPIVGIPILLYLMDWDFGAWGDIEAVIYVGFTIVFAWSSIVLFRMWRYRHSRTKVFEGTFEEIGQRLEEFLKTQDIKFQVSVVFKKIQDQGTRSRDNWGTAEYDLSIDDNDILIIMIGSTVRQYSWIAIEPWMDG
ncbi:MAG: hypothetical protein KAS77_11855, partial [Thermoplasmata archaeon]|nr:hypothetical protein [Thermoplasmata archaeon]